MTESGHSDLVWEATDAHREPMRKAAALAFLLLVGACGGSDPPTYADADSGAEIRVETGDSFQVSLESNRTTGFEWVLSGFEELDGVLSLESEEFVEPDSDLVGSPGIQIFTFEAAEDGAGVLRFEYVRPFDDPPVPDRIVEFIVRVGDAPWPPPGGTPATGTATAPDS